MKPKPPRNGPGFLEVGTKDGEVIINLPRDMTGHIVFSPAQAYNLSRLLAKKAAEAAASES